MDIKSGSWAEISLDKIGHNLRTIKKTLNYDKKICCVVKANAYGCGSVEISKYLQTQNIDFLAVARIEEALEIRRNNINIPILCLGYTDLSFIKEAIDKEISITVYDVDYIKEISKIATSINKNARIHIKIDTGMSRLGFKVEDAVEKIKEIYKLNNIEIEGIFTHFARADESDKSTTIKQYNLFKYIISSLEDLNISIPIKHVANSAAIIDLDEDLFNMVRLGIALFGYFPSEEIMNNNLNLKPCLKLKSVVTNVKIVENNVGISYGHQYVTSKRTKIITISIGYADGFNRVQENPKVLTNGYLLNIVGRICMDQCMAEAPLDAKINVGDEVTIIDNDIEELSLESHAKRNHTINYEILCMINRRVIRVYELRNKTFSINYLLD